MGSISSKRFLQAGIAAVCVAVIVAGLVRATFSADSITAAPETLVMAPLSQFEAAISRIYIDEYGQPVFRPAVSIAPESCQRGTRTYAVTTAYLDRQGSRSDVLYAYLDRDASAVYKDRQRGVLTPRGRFRVLVMITRHQPTLADHGLALWEEAQERINKDHEEFALSRGYPAPIVSFENTNIIVDPTQLSDPRAPIAVRSAADRMRIVPTDFDLLVSLDLDPARLEGGFADAASRFVYVGNFSGWRGPLDASDWLQVARTVYHHEISHHWGWRHEWSPSCDRKRPFAPFLTDPKLLGWEDLDGDGVPEIIDKTPYGRSRH